MKDKKKREAIKEIRIERKRQSSKERDMEDETEKREVKRNTSENT